MRVLVPGSGAREHALAAALKPDVDQLYVAPGNGGTAEIAENVDLKATDIPGLVDFALKNKIDYTVVASDNPIRDGVVDAFNENKLSIFGPTRAASEIEWSKTYAKLAMAACGIPTAVSELCDNPESALAYLRSTTFPRFGKADGLALGKGSFDLPDLATAEQFVQDVMVDRIFGDAGDKVVFEEHLGGPLQSPEASLQVFTDGKTAKAAPAFMDHKHAGAGGTGLMTGGVGTAGPIPGITDAHMAAYNERIVDPMLAYLRKQGRPFNGLIFPGLKLLNGNPADPRVLEFNARFGDPETSVLVRLLQSSLLELLMACTHGELDKVNPIWKKAAAVCIVLCAGGYPGEADKGREITGLDRAQQHEGVEVFHGGTTRLPDGRLVNTGGRVLNVTASGEDLTQARDRARAALNEVQMEGGWSRPDIADQAIAGLRPAV